MVVSPLNPFSILPMIACRTLVYPMMEPSQMQTVLTASLPNLCKSPAACGRTPVIRSPNRLTPR